MKIRAYRSAVLLILAAALVVLPVGAKAEMYVEAYLGGNFPGSSSFGYGASPAPGYAYTVSAPGNFDPAVIGGLKIGTWFVKEGVLGFNYPEWMKYLGFYVDFSYHRLNLRHQAAHYRENYLGSQFQGVWNLDTNGHAATLAFMFAGRYGFLPDSEVPFGRLQPYVAVGPAIMFTSQAPTFNFASYTGPYLTDSQDLHSQSATVLALAVEAGLRWMALKNVSLDASFKYRYAVPSYSYLVDPGGNGFFLQRHSMTMDQTLNLFSFQVGAAYHF